MNEPKKFIEATVNLTELANKVYDDGFHKPVKQFGDLMSIVPEFLRALAFPVEKWSLERNYNISEIQKKLSQKLENIDADNIVESQQCIAIPAIQAMSYCYNSAELHNLYANLLARSMIKDEQNKVHPSFVEIIKQLSPLDAEIFKSICSSENKPVIHIKWIADNTTGYVDGPSNITWITTYDYPLISLSIDNLIRLNLIILPFGDYYKEEKAYDIILNSDKFKEYESTLITPSKTYPKILHRKNLIEVTSYGKSFYDVCVKDI